MKSPDHQSKVVERLYSLTLLVNEAIDQDAAQDLTSLLEQRGKAIGDLDEHCVSDENRLVLAKVTELGYQIESKLLRNKSESLVKLQEIANTRTGIRSYQKQR